MTDLEEVEAELVGTQVILQQKEAECRAYERRITELCREYLQKIAAIELDRNGYKATAEEYMRQLAASRAEVNLLQSVNRSLHQQLMAATDPYDSTEESRAKLRQELEQAKAGIVAVLKETG